MINVNGKTIKFDLENNAIFMNSKNSTNRKGDYNKNTVIKESVRPYTSEYKYKINGVKLKYGEDSCIKANLSYGDESYIEMEEGNITFHGFNLELTNI